MIFITGAARSGTSLTTKILQAHGLYLGPRRQVNELYEHLGIRQTILKPMLEAVGADPLGQGPLPNMAKYRPDESLRLRVEPYFVVGPEPWGYKDAKLTLTWPMWHAAFPEAKWIIVRRDTEAIIDSCLRCHFMKRHGKIRGRWHAWVGFHLLQFGAMRNAGLNTIELWPAQFIRSSDYFSGIADFCGLDFDADKVTDAINPNLWGAKHG